jgi:hypothetical protein
MACCGYAVLMLGLVCNSRWAKRTITHSDRVPQAPGMPDNWNHRPF